MSVDVFEEAKMQFNLIGAGRLGQNLATALVHSGLAKLNGLYNQSTDSAKTALANIGSGYAVEYLHDLPKADLTIITTPDDIIYSIAEQLAENKIVSSGHVVIHCSGVLSSTELAPLTQLGCYTASIHPLKAFRVEDVESTSLQSCDCVMEGHEQALKLLRSLFQPLGANLILIPPERKAIYHAAAVFASNYLVTLASIAIDLLQETGISASSAQQMTSRLMTTSLTHIQQAHAIPEALTGPLARGDINTINKHLHGLQHNTAIHNLYQAMARATLPITTLSDELKSKLNALLIN